MRLDYTSMGHRADIWSNDPVFRAHISGGRGTNPVFASASSASSAVQS
jgi:hypothetical protein